MPENHALALDKWFVLKSAPPWEIKGELILLVFKFNKKWVEEKGLLPKHLSGKFKGGFGYIILGKNSSTPIGPFHDLLFVPGKFRKTKRLAITKNYTNTEASTQNGRANWGTPKETLPIEWKTEGKKDFVRVLKEGNPIFALELESTWIPFPVSTTFYPIRLCQTWNKLKFYTRPTGSGWGKLAKIKSLDLDPEFFPDIRGISPIVAIKVNSFDLRLPEATFQKDVE